MFFEINKGPSRQIEINGKDFLFFSGTSYLGLADNTDFNALLQSNLNQYGSSFGVSRNGNLKLSIYQEAEQSLARFVGAESALTLSSGMLAGQAVIQSLKAQNPIFIYAPQAHPANWHEPVVTISQLSFEEWAKDLIENIPINNQKKVIVCNTIDALKMTKSDFRFLNHLPDNQDITVIIDDSHGLGVMNAGKGIFGLISAKINLIVVSSLHKAFGIPGGVVFGQKGLIDSLATSIFFSACSPVAPAYLATYLQATSLYETSHQKLKKNVLLFKNNVSNLSIFRFHDDHCVFYIDNPGIYQYLFDRHIFIYNFAYPDVYGKPNTRIVLSAWHTETDVLMLATAINSFIEAHF